MDKFLLRRSLLLSISTILIAFICSGAIFAGTMDTYLNGDLIKATFLGNLPAVQQLIEKGANVNAKREDGVTALMGASLEGNPEIVALLLAKGANVNETASIYGRSGTTACDLASQEGHQEIVDMLVKAGATLHGGTVAAPKSNQRQRRKRDQQGNNTTN